MDGILGDRIEQERLFRPVTLSYALDNFPRFILRMKQQRLLCLSTTVIRGKKFYKVRDRINKHENWIILEVDFDLCKEIAGEVKLRVFPFDTMKKMEDNIRALIRVSFSDRSF